MIFLPVYNNADPQEAACRLLALALRERRCLRGAAFLILLCLIGGVSMHENKPNSYEEEAGQPRAGGVTFLKASSAPTHLLQLFYLGHYPHFLSFPQAMFPAWAFAALWLHQLLLQSFTGLSNIFEKPVQAQRECLALPLQCCGQRGSHSSSAQRASALGISPA